MEDTLEGCGKENNERIRVKCFVRAWATDVLTKLCIIIYVDQIFVLMS